MEQIKKIPKHPLALAGTAIFVMMVLVLILAEFNRKREEKAEAETETVAYEYTPEEQELAEAVEAYLAGYIALDRAESLETADAAVRSYRTILASGIKNVSEEHTLALSQRMRHALEAAAGTERMTEEGLEALADGTCGVIWDFILAQIETGELSEEEEFTQWSEGLQEQIDELKDRNLSLKISANIKEKGISREELENSEQSLLSQVGDGILGAKDNIMKEIENRFGNIRDGKDGKDGEDGKDGANGKDGASGQNGSNGRDGKDGEDGRDGRAGTDGRDGADGKDGEDGKNGIDGKDGKDGTDGEDGASVHVMFSEYPAGRDADGTVSMGMAQSNTTKYMGTAYTSGKEAPTDPESYTWSEYKDYIIFFDTDESGTPTVHIQ